MKPEMVEVTLRLKVPRGMRAADLRRVVERADQDIAEVEMVDWAEPEEVVANDLELESTNG